MRVRPSAARGWSTVAGRTQSFIALCLSVCLSRALLLDASAAAEAYQASGTPALSVILRARLAACKTLAKLQGLSGTAITDAVQHGRSSYDHSSDRSSGLNDAGIDRFLLGLDGCGIPVSSTSGTHHCPLRHAHATCVETNLGRPRHRRDTSFL